MRIEKKVRTKEEWKRVARAAREANIETLPKAGFEIRRAAKRLIKKRKRPAPPGQPIHSASGHFKRVIRYDVQKGENVAVGPTNEYAKTIWDIHEFGASNVRLPVKRLSNASLKIGGWGPARFVRGGGDRARVRNDGGRDRRFNRAGKPKFMRIKIRTSAQLARARRLLDEENDARESDAAKPRNYPKRPTMGPALETVQPRLPKLWKDSVST